MELMAKYSPVTMIGEAIWGDEAGAVHVLQVEFSLDGFFSARSLAALTFLQFHKNIQHLIDSHTCIQAFVARTPQLHMGSFSSELYAAPTAVADESLQQPSYVEFTWSNLPQRKGASASFVAAHTRCALCFVRLVLLHNRISIAIQSPRALVTQS